MRTACGTCIVYCTIWVYNCTVCMQLQVEFHSNKCWLMYTMISCLELIFAVQYIYNVMSLHVYSYTQRGVRYNVTVYVQLCYMLCHP